MVNPPAGLIVTPGASADRDHSTLVALEQGLPEIEVVRLTLATTSANRGVAKIVEAAAELAERLDVAPSEIALGGRSFGGRCASMAHAEGLQVHSLILLSYPLHPPGKPEKLRTEHFGDVTAPCLFISGERDPFGSPAEFAEYVPLIAGPVTTEWVPGGHSPKAEDEIVSRVRTWLRLS
ncbi:MAG: alpha/beta family hydrolase [Acidimicrobiales bacterium]